MEAATITLECAFRPQRKQPEGFKLLTKKVNPAVGSKLFVWKNGDIGNDKKLETISFVDAARNAGLLDLVRFVERI